MRALVVTNMWPSPDNPALGSFVRDQVDALRELDGVDVEVFAFPPGGYARAARELRRRHRGGEFDVVHAHFGLSAWPALALRGTAHVVTLHGTDLRHPRSKRITRAALPFLDLIAAVSPELAREVPGAGAAWPCCPAASTSTASRRSRAPRRASGSASRATSRASCSPPTPRGPRSGSTAHAKLQTARDS
jgi:hypothetical protein